MLNSNEIQKALAAVDMQQGLSVKDVHAHLYRGARLGDTSQRLLSFYLTEMADRRLHQVTGHSDTSQFAEDRLGLPARRTRELIVVGRKLLTLPAIDVAFCRQEIGWSKVLLLARVAVPEHEEVWLAKAKALNCKALALEVKLGKAGRAPRKDDNQKGLPEVRFQVGARVDVVSFQKMELAKQKLAAEFGRPVTDAELMTYGAELVLGSDDDGSLQGRTRVDASLYRVIVRAADRDGTSGDEDGSARFSMDTDDGPMPIGLAEAIRCDGECIQILDEDPEGASRPSAHRDPKTSAQLRRRTLARDGATCRCCGARRRLMVHHIAHRSHGGATRIWNLISLCSVCHALVHADLLNLEGKQADRIRFLDCTGDVLHAPGAFVPASALLILAAPTRDASGAPAEPHAEPSLADLLPDVINGAWWRRNAHRIRARKDRGLALMHGASTPACGSSEAEVLPPPPPATFADAFAGIHGQADLLGRLERTAAGCRRRGKVFPHTLLTGPAGTGKTTFAKGLAACVGARLTDISGPLLQDAHALVSVLAGLGEGDILFVDEVHAIPRVVLETLYQALVERHLSLTFHEGSLARCVRLDLPAFTLVAATTEDDELPDALRGRFGLCESLEMYSVEDLAALVAETTRAEGLPLEEEAALRLAEHARGTPREALRLLERVLDDLSRRSVAVLNRTAVESALRGLGFDSQGLKPVERRYLAALRESPAPIPLDRLARILGINARTVAALVEPFLFRLGLVHVTSLGRSLSADGGAASGPSPRLTGAART